MATLLEMRTWVSKRLKDPNGTSVPFPDVVECINMALNYWKGITFYFNEFQAPVTISQVDGLIDLPDDFLCPSIDDEAFYIDYSGMRYSLKKDSKTYYNNIFLTNGFGMPWRYARLATSGYFVYPIPDRDYDAFCYYLKDYAPFVNDGDTNDFSVNAENLLQYTAAAYAARDLRYDTTMYDAFMAQAMVERDSLIRVTNKSNATGSLTLYSLL